MVAIDGFVARHGVTWVSQTFLTGFAQHDACFGGAFGRTMSPVSAVVVYSAGVVGLSPIVLIRRFLPAPRGRRGLDRAGAALTLAARG